MGNFNASLIFGGNPEEIFRGIKAISGNGKKGDFEQVGMFRAVAKIPISNTSNGLVEMDFADYGNFATFLHTQATRSRFSAIVF